MTRSLHIVLAAVLLAAAACAGPTNDVDGDVLVLGDTTDTVQLEGTVWYYDYDEGFWAIDTGSKIYEPENLPEAFKEDGQRVAVHALVRSGVESRELTGPIIEIRRIERL